MSNQQPIYVYQKPNQLTTLLAVLVSLIIAIPLSISIAIIISSRAQGSADVQTTPAQMPVVYVVPADSQSSNGFVSSCQDVTSGGSGGGNGVKLSARDNRHTLKDNSDKKSGVWNFFNTKNHKSYYNKNSESNVHINSHNTNDSYNESDVEIDVDKAYGSDIGNNIGNHVGNDQKAEYEDNDTETSIEDNEVNVNSGNEILSNNDVEIEKKYEDNDNLIVGLLGGHNKNPR